MKVLLLNGSPHPNGCIEQHTWMATASNFYEKAGYNYERFDDTGYTNLAMNGEKQYRGNEEHYRQCLVDEIRRVA